MPLSGKQLKVLIIAPIGRDSQLLRDALVSAELNAHIVGSIQEALPLLENDTIGALLITEEVLNVGNIALLGNELASQPAWSDLPILILTVGGSSTTSSRRREQERLPLGSPILLERPIRSATLISSVRSALRSRRRQYQVRDTLLERDRADEARRDTESRLLTAIEAARLGSWELNVRTGELLASATFRRNCGFEADEALTYEKFLERVHPEDQERLRENLNTAIQNGAAYAAEYRILWRDGTVRWMSANGRLMGEAKPGTQVGGAREDRDIRVAGVTLDITERVLSEIALRRADKLALVGRLSSSIAHEINNPLESVTNLLYLLAGAQLEPVEKEYVALAQHELARVSEITAQTLAFNRQQNAFGPVIVSEILDSVLALYQGRLSTSGIHVERRYTYQKPVLCYPGEIRQVFTNLIGNAFDATRQGGRIVVRERLASHPRSGQQGVRITIADTGVGMSPDVRAHVFEAFFSTKGNNGTGLGLWISSGIAKKHGGSLRLSSSTAAAHSGSVFSLFLPLAS